MGPIAGTKIIIRAHMILLVLSLNSDLIKSTIAQIRRIKKNTLIKVKIIIYQ